MLGTTGVLVIVYFLDRFKGQMFGSRLDSWRAAVGGESFSLLIGIFTGVLSFTLVFRINLAYGRWWDSRRSAEAFAVKLVGDFVQEFAVKLFGNFVEEGRRDLVFTEVAIIHCC